jgi:hypothetical protein
MSSSYLISLAGWYFLPNLVTNWLQTIYYRFALRAGDPAPQPGTPRFTKHRRVTYCLVIVSYLLYCIYEADWQVRKAGTFYEDLGVGIEAGERVLQRRLRLMYVYSSPNNLLCYVIIEGMKITNKSQSTGQLHPDKYPEHQKHIAHEAFIVVKSKADTLIDPARRFAYDRFGPDSTQWKHCKTIQDYVWQGVQNGGVPYLAALIMMVVAHILGMMPHGRYVSAILPSPPNSHA